MLMMIDYLYLFLFASAEAGRTLIIFSRSANMKVGSFVLWRTTFRFSSI